MRPILRGSDRKEKISDTPTIHCSILNIFRVLDIKLGADAIPVEIRHRDGKKSDGHDPEDPRK